jgi:hypothetical protein
LGFNHRGKLAFKSAGNAAMEFLPLVARQCRVRGIPDERVLEYVSHVRVSVSSGDYLGSDEVCDGGLKRAGVFGGDRCQLYAGKLTTNYCANLGNFFSRTEAVKAGG